LTRAQRALIFALDGTLVDTVYAHVFAWQRAFAEVGLPIDGWRIQEGPVETAERRIRDSNPCRRRERAVS
jgi:beta-phosphoglucomutase-like phosphatase (HAD superfamily)